MTFSPDQKKLLEAKLDRANVKSRVQGKAQVSYIEGWHVIAEANRIFGFDQWNRETLELRSISENKRKIGKGEWEKDGWGVSYIARVRVTVTSLDRLQGVIREGVGIGHGIDADLGQAHESAAKEAETDAMKRALMTFGNQFGLALYDKVQTNVEDTPPPSPAVKASKPEEIEASKRGIIAALLEAKTLHDLGEFWKARQPEIKALPASYNAEVTNAKDVHKATLQAMERVNA